MPSSNEVHKVPVGYNKRTRRYNADCTVCTFSVSAVKENDAAKQAVFHEKKKGPKT